MGTAVKHPVPDRVKPECPDVKNYKWRLNPVRYRMLYSCTHMATVGGKGLMPSTAVNAMQPSSRRTGSVALVEGDLTKLITAPHLPPHPAMGLRLHPR